MNGNVCTYVILQKEETLMNNLLNFFIQKFKF